MHRAISCLDERFRRTNPRALGRECDFGKRSSSHGRVQVAYLSAGVIMISLAAVVWEQVARTRATHNFKPLDALHLATAVEHGCGLFLTNDTQLRSFPDILVEVLT